MTTPLTRPAPAGLLRSVASAWNRFWFTPADPTTLGFMRVCAGLLALWVHLVYSYDLFSYLGAGSWLDPRALEYLRYHMPVYAQSDGWTESDLEEATRLRQLEQARPLNEAEQRRYNDLQGVLQEHDRRMQQLHDSREDDLKAAGALWVTLARWQYAQAREAARSGRPAAEQRPLAEARGSLKRLVPWMEPLREEWLLLQEQSVAKLGAKDQRRLDELEARRYLKEAEDLWKKEQSGAALTGDEQARLDELEPRLWEVEKARPLTEEEQRKLDALELRLQGYNDGEPYARGQFLWSVYFHITDPNWIIAAHVAVLAVFLLFTLGVCTRVTSALAWMAAIGYVQRLPNHLFGMDTMMVLLLFYLMIGPSGAALSLDRVLARWMQRRRGALPSPAAGRPQPSVLANFALRLVQVNFCIIYLASGTSKLLGSAWWNGTALWLCMANASFAPMKVGAYYDFLIFLCQHRWLWEIFLTGGVIFTLFTELGFPFLVWQKKLRWVMVSCSVLLHLGIGLVMGLVVFSLFMMVMVVAFVPPEAVRAQLQQLGDQLRRLFRGDARTAPPTPAVKSEELVLSRS
jgi:hypothetical protein